MKKIKVLTVVFEGKFKPHEIPSFRGAIVEKVGRDNILFHNHLKNGYLYKYPLIQYKSISGSPAIVCIDDGVDEIHKYFQSKSWSIHINSRELEMKIHSLNLSQFTMQVWDKMFNYKIRNWIALNQINIGKYKQIEGLAERILFLEKTLIGNIISFAKGISWDVTQPIIIRIKNIEEPKPLKLKQSTLLGFNVEFSSNVIIPNYIGLGKGASKGFGVVNNCNNRN